MTNNIIPPREAAALIGVSETTLHRWRKAGKGPAYAIFDRVGRDDIKFGYYRQSVLKFANGRKKISERIRELKVALNELDNERGEG